MSQDPRDDVATTAVTPAVTVEPAPAEPAPVESAPVEPAPVEPESAPAEPPVPCPACGTIGLPGDRFCQECGASLHGDTSSPDAVAGVTPAALTGAAIPGLLQPYPVTASAAAAGDPAVEAGCPAVEAAPPAVWGTASGATTYPTPLAFIDPDAPPAYAGTTVAPLVEELRTCPSCGGTVALDGYCLECGTLAPVPRDHFVEQPATWVAGVCDRGIVHHRNEDAMALGVAHGGAAAPSGTGLLVVCDGVSSAPDSDVASLAGARAALAAIAGSVATAAIGAPRAGMLSAAVVAGARAAAQAVTASASPGHEDANPPSCTYVACAVEPGTIVTAWIGDSRAYWFPEGGTPVQLSQDHSWAREMIALGMPREEAETARNAHAITRWLGADATDVEADVAVVHPNVPGTVLVCSDGLWNYCSEATALAALVASTREEVGDEPLALAGALVTWAKGQGGRDNVTVAIAHVA